MGGTLRSGPGGGVGRSFPVLDVRLTVSRYAASFRAASRLRSGSHTQEGVRAGPQNPSAMVVLGIDPGTANTGYGVVARHDARLVALDGGVIETGAGRDPGERLAQIHARVGALLDEYRPDALAVEDLYFGTNAHSAFAVGQARGVVVLAAGQRGLPCCSYTPQQIKGAVCGSGRADKGQVQRMVQTLLALTDLPRPDHAADALAVAICHANGAALRAAEERARVSREHAVTGSGS
jgi:crossover junction endodeoxyribonuclease RuvC